HQITHFFSVATVFRIPLVSVNTRIAPKRQEGAVANQFQFAFSRGYSVCALNRCCCSNTFHQLFLHNPTQFQETGGGVRASKNSDIGRNIFSALAVNLSSTCCISS